MRIGLALPHYDFSFPDRDHADVDATARWAETAETLGFDSVWMSDHFFLDLQKYGGSSHRFGSLEPLVTLAVVAARTRRIRLGSLVLVAAFRHPAMLAKAAATLDLASGGRLDLGLGAGWYEAEFRAMGFPFERTQDRIAHLREYVQVVRGMLSGDEFSFEGSAFRVERAPNRPYAVQRPHPPIWIGSKGGPRMLRLVAGVADGWNTAWRCTPAAYRERVDALERACTQAGRDPSTVRRSVGLSCLIGEDEQDLRHRWAAWQRWAPAGTLDDAAFSDYRSDALVGTLDQCAERIREFAALGVEEIILSFANLPFAVADADQLQLVAEQLIPKVR